MIRIPEPGTPEAFTPNIPVGTPLHEKGTVAELRGIYLGPTENGEGAWIAWVHPGARDTRGYPTVTPEPWEHLEIP